MIEGGMTDGELDDLIKKHGVEIEGGCIYNVFDCCITPQENSSEKIMIKIDGKMTTRLVCVEHKGHILTKFKICPTCSKYVIGACSKQGETCADCRPTVYKKNNIEHPRGKFCKFYVVEEKGCCACDNCWYCETLHPIFKGTGPKMRRRNGRV